jgi:hypothetical protein
LVSKVAALRVVLGKKWTRGGLRSKL